MAKAEKRRVVGGKPCGTKKKALDGEASDSPAADVMQTLWSKARKGDTRSVEILLKLGYLKERHSDEAERVLLELVEMLLARPGLCVARPSAEHESEGVMEANGEDCGRV